MGEFEKDIRDLFADLEVKIDTNEIWPGIEKSLDKRDKKRPIWWILAPIFLILIGGIYVYNLKNTTTNNNSQTSIDYPKSKSSHKQSASNDSYNNKNSVDNLNINSTNTQSNLNKDISLPQKTKIKNNQLINYKKVRKNNPIKKEKIKYNFAINNIQTQNSSSNNANLSTSSNKASDQNSIVTNSSTNINKTILNIGKLTNSLKLISYKNKLNLKANFSKFKETHNSNQVPSWNKSIDFGIGFALVNKYLNAKSDKYLIYQEKRENTEKYLEAINSNVSININHKSGFFISTGIDYTQIDERFTNADSIDFEYKDDGIIKEELDANGQSTTLRGQKEFINHTKWDKEIYNYYYFIDIPVSLGYSLSINKTKIEISSGLSYNIAFMKKGQIIGLNRYPVDISEEKGLFTSNSGLSFISDLKILFPIKNHLFYIEPNIKYNLKSITHKDNPLEQKYLTYGIKIGSRFKF